MKKKLLATLLLVVPLLTVSSCIKSGDEMGECVRNMRIELRWVGTEPLNNSENVDIEIDPASIGTRADITSDIYGVNIDLQADSYNLVAWETHTNSVIDAEDHTLAVNRKMDGTAESPNIFSAGYKAATVAMDKSSEVIIIPMHRQTRPLVIELDFSGDGFPFIESITGNLSGVALKRHMDNAFPPVSGLSRPAAIESGIMKYSFLPYPGRATITKYRAEENLIGIDGNSSQILTLNVQFAGENEATPYLFDLTSDLSQFQTKDINEPWYVVLGLGLGFDLEVTIVDWKSGPESWITAH